MRVTNGRLAMCESIYAPILRVTNVPASPLRFRVSILRCVLRQGPLASVAPAGPSDYLLRAISHLGSLVCRRPARFNDHELRAREMALSQALLAGAVDRHPAQRGAARRLQVPPGSSRHLTVSFSAKVL